MAANENSLLLRIRGDSSGGKAAVAETRAAVAQLRHSFGPELTQTVSASNKVFSQLGDNLNVFVSQRLPLVGGAFLRVTENISGLNRETNKQEATLRKVADSISGLASTTGKSIPQLTSFLTQFVKIEGQANRDAAAIKFFGAEVLANNAKIIPATEKAATEMASLAVATEGAGVAAGGIALPVGVAVVAITALATGAALAARELFGLSKRTAEFQGAMVDLSQQTGVGVKTLSAFEILAKTTGGSLGTMTQALVLFQRKLEDGRDLTSKSADLLRKYRIETNDTESALRQAFTALAAMPEGFTQTNAAAELFGARGGKQILAILKETNGDLDGAIKRFRGLGILISEEDARAADRFNDELAILDFQLRAASAALVRELIPSLTEVIRSFGRVVTAARPFINIATTIAGATGRSLESFFLGLSITVQALTGDFKGLNDQLKELEERKNIPALTVPDLRVPLPGAKTTEQVEAEATQLADAAVAAAKRAATRSNQALDSLFQQGRINREKQAQQVIADNKRILDAELAQIDARLKQRETEIKGLNQADTQYEDNLRKATEEVQKLQQDRLDKENQFEVTAAAIRAKAAKERADAIRNQRANETDLLIGEFDRQIKEIEAAIDRQGLVESEGLTVIEALERAKIDARREGLEEQKRIGFLTLEEQRDLSNRIQALNQEADRLGDEQRQRRLARERAAAARTRDILIASLDTLLDIERVQGEARIATIEALAQLRIKSEQQAARDILAIRLQLIDDEIEATRAKLAAAGTLATTAERVKAQAELNNQLKVLNAQRVALEQQGARDIAVAQQTDLDNQRDYADELGDIQQRIADIERDTADEVIRLMVLHVARRRDIIRAQRDLNLADEDARHTRVTESIRAQQREVDEQIKVLERHIERLKVGTTEEIEEHDRLIASLEALRQQRLALQRQQDAEDERNRTRKRRVTTKADKDEKETDPFEKFKIGIEDIKKFTEELEDSVVPIGEILARTFHQVADAIGQTVANWVLLGETGPAVMRKILAQALASIAAEAAVNAIKELALGFATLFFNPADSAAHFTSAALWASIGGVAAIAGRGVAGDLFKPKGAASGGTEGRNTSGEINPLNLARNAGPGTPQIAPQIQSIRLILEHRVDEGKFAKAITTTVVDDFNNAGPIREVIGGDGNLNRG